MIVNPASWRRKGDIEIRYRDRGMRWHELAAASLLATQTKSPQAWRPRPVPSSPAAVRASQPRPSLDHPWRRGFEARAQRRAAQVAAQ